MKLKCLIIYFYFLLSFSVHATTGVCLGIGLDQNFSINRLMLSANQIECMNTRQNYLCEKMEADLEGDDKNKIIQCDKKSLASNNVTNMSLGSCVWNGFKMSGENLIDLIKLPGLVMQAAIKGFHENQECNNNLEKKRQLLNAFNASVTDKRFKLEKSFPDMPCSEIEKLAHARYENYMQQIDREMRAAKITGKNYKMPIELMAKNSDLLKKLDEVFKKAGIAYNCYTPKAKAEMICTGVTNLLADIALGAGTTKAIAAVKSYAKSKRVLSNIKQAVNSAMNGNLAEKLAVVVSPEERMQLMAATGLHHIEDSSDQVVNIYKILGTSTNDGHAIVTSNLPKKPLNVNFSVIHSKAPTSVRYQFVSEDGLLRILNKGIPSRARVKNIKGIEEVERLAASDREIFNELAFTQKLGMNKVNVISVETTESVPVIKEFAKRVHLLKDNDEGFVFVHVKNDRAIPYENNIMQKGTPDNEKGNLFLGGIHSQEIKLAFYVKRSNGKIIYEKHERINGQWKKSEISKESFESQVANI